MFTHHIYSNIFFFSFREQFSEKGWMLGIVYELHHRVLKHLVWKYLYIIREKDAQLCDQLWNELPPASPLAPEPEVPASPPVPAPEPQLPASPSVPASLPVPAPEPQVPASPSVPASSLVPSPPTVPDSLEDEVNHSPLCIDTYSNHILSRKPSYSSIVKYQNIYLDLMSKTRL